MPTATMVTYTLFYQKEAEEFTVPEKKAVYLVRAPQVIEGTATVTDELTGKKYVIPEDQATIRTSIKEGQKVKLKFTERTNDDISFVNVEVITPRD
jgi:RNase P/RNase MRP subunit p29